MQLPLLPMREIRIISGRRNFFWYVSLLHKPLLPIQAACINFRVSLPGSRIIPEKSILFTNLTYYLKLRNMQCFLGCAQWLNVSIHVLTPWSSITPKSKPFGVSLRVCVCVRLRVRRVVCTVYYQYDFSCCYKEHWCWLTAWLDIYDTITNT